MEEKIGLHCFVSGRVQGVFFRASTQEEAKALGLTGFAKNLPDGRVEVVACGDKANVLKLYAWLKKGPSNAVVTEVTYEELPWKDYTRFGIQ
jgi:acylphosphatase